MNGEDGVSLVSRSVAVAETLLSLDMDADSVAAGVASCACVAGLLTVDEARLALGSEPARLLHDVCRAEELPKRFAFATEEEAKGLRAFSLAFHDVRAVVIAATRRMHQLRFADRLPQYRRNILALEAMQANLEGERRERERERVSE